MPTRCIEGEQIEFNLDKFEGGNIYQIQDTLIEARIQILTSDDKLPAKTVIVGPRNNVLHTLFDKCEMYINEQRITNSSDNYAYKSYITTVLSYPDFCKNTHLQTQGWATDTVPHFDSVANNVNLGFVERHNNFRENFTYENNYRKEGALFIGRLMHDLVSCETGLPPNTKVKFLLSKNRDSFILQKSASDTASYKIRISHICLYVPVAQVSLPVYNEINSILSRKHEPKSIAIPFRRLEVRCISIPVNKEDYYSDSLFTQTDLPCRMVICFIEAKAKIGDSTKNPYNFLRKWKYQADGFQQHGQQFQSFPLMEERFSRLEKQFMSFMEQMQNKTDLLGKEAEKSTKKKGKNLKRKNQKTHADESEEHSGLTLEELVRLESQKRLREFLAQSQNERENQDERDSVRESFYSTQPPFNPSAPPMPGTSSGSTSNLEGPVEKTVFLKKIEVLLNSAPLDQLDDEQTEDECIKTFWRMFAANGQINNIFSSSITYTDFRQGYFFACYDLSTSSKSGTNYVTPQIRVGHVRVR